MQARAASLTVEQLPLKESVTGSNPVRLTIKKTEATFQVQQNLCSFFGEIMHLRGEIFSNFML